MGATFYFSPEQNGPVQTSCCAEPDGRGNRAIELAEADGSLLLFVTETNGDRVELMLTPEQAQAFALAAVAICERVGLITSSDIRLPKQIPEYLR